MRERKKHDIIAISVLAAIIAVIPLFTSSRYIFSMCISIFTMAAFGTAWNIIGGYAGQIGFAHSAFFSIGAYCGVLCYLKLGISPWWGLLLGLAISLLASLFIGTITLRYKGTYFMFCTIAFTKCIEVILLWKKDITGGAGGLVIPIKGNHFSLLVFKDTRYYYFLLGTVLIIALVISWGIEQSKVGYYMRAIKADINAAESLGIESKNYKIMAFLISSAIVSAAGTIYAFYMGYVDPTSVGGVDLSTRILAYAIVGGIGQLFGPLLGAILLVPLNDLVNTVGPGGSGTLLYGIALILIMRFLPKGMISLLVDDFGHIRLFRWLRLHRSKRVG